MDPQSSSGLTVGISTASAVPNFASEMADPSIQKLTFKKVENFEREKNSKRNRGVKAKLM
jgi:hypothetical protein